MTQVEAMRRILRKDYQTADGAVVAVVGMIRKLGLDEMIAARRSRERDLVH
jgi:hypothetical protein